MVGADDGDMWLEHGGPLPRFCARVDVDMMLERCRRIGVIAEAVGRLASLCGSTTVNGLQFAVTDTDARDVLMDGGSAQLVPPRVVSARS